LENIEIIALKIREYHASDMEQVIELWVQSGLVVPWNDPKKDIHRKLKVDPDLFLVGEIDGKVVATVMGGYEGHRGWINYLAVSPSLRRNGYASKLMQEAERRIKDKGCPKINLQVRESNVDTIGFYESIGYGKDHAVSLGKRLESDLKPED